MSNSERLSWGNLIFLFIVMFLFGIITKKAAGEHMRIGFDDPTTVISRGTLYDIDELEQKILRQEKISMEASPDEIAKEAH